MSTTPLQTLRTRVNQAENRIARLEKRLEVIETNVVAARKEVQEGFETVNEKIDGLYRLLDGFVKRVRKTDEEVAALVSHVRRLETRLTVVEKQLAKQAST